MPKESRTAHLDQIDSHSNSDLSDHELSTFSSMKEEDGDTPASMGSQTDSASQLSFPLVNTRRPATPIPGQRSIFDSSALRSISSDSSPTSEGTAPLLSAQQLLVQVDEWITYLNTHQSLWLERRSNNHATSNGGTETPDIERGLVWTGKVKAVLVGINYVSWDSNQLGGCYHDTETMRELLQNSGLPHPPDIKHITDVDPNATQPTRETILSAFEQLITNSEAGDVLVFHYSGHGARVPDHNNSESDGQDDAWVPPQYKPLGNEALIIDDELHVLVEKLPWNRFLLVISDSCHSGTMLDLGKKITNPNHGPVIGIGGCRDPETSSDTLMNGSRCGVMTNALLRIIEQAGGFVPFVRDYLTRVSGRAEVERSLRALIKSQNFTQQPQVSYEGVDLRPDLKLNDSVPLPTLFSEKNNVGLFHSFNWPLFVGFALMLCGAVVIGCSTLLTLLTTLSVGLPLLLSGMAMLGFSLYDHREQVTEAAGQTAPPTAFSSKPSLTSESAPKPYLPSARIQNMSKALAEIEVRANREKRKVTQTKERVRADKRATVL